jgi:transcriptional repressor NrdR
MRCPACGHDQSRVTDSRTVQNGASIRRRRECETCGRRFTTYERLEESLPMIVKRDGRREPYNRDKLLHGLRLACRKRPVSTRDVEALADSVERTLAKLDKGEVNSALLGDRVMDGLRALDQIAYIRFASVYLSFDDIASFDHFLGTLDHGRQSAAHQAHSDEDTEADGQRAEAGAGVAAGERAAPGRPDHE